MIALNNAGFPSLTTGLATGTTAGTTSATSTTSTSSPTASTARSITAATHSGPSRLAVSVDIIGEIMALVVPAVGS